jgi:hypothetical protein
MLFVLIDTEFPVSGSFGFFYFVWTLAPAVLAGDHRRIGHLIYSTPDIDIEAANRIESSSDPIAGVDA